MNMLKESGLYSFIDEKEGFVLHFLEGQQLIKTLAIIHPLGGSGLSGFRDAVLMFEPIISFLKPQEGFGLYIDSTDPQFMLKIEANAQGLIRTLLLPENFDQFPKKIKGVARLTKVFGPTKESQYSSSIELNDIGFHEIANKILKDSYQVSAKCFLSEESDQSILIMKLPGNKNEKGLEEYWELMQPKIEKIFAQALNEKQEIVLSFEDMGLIFLNSKEVLFNCNCNRERMLSGVRALMATGSTIESLFGEDDSIELKCDYCKTTYLITKKEIS
jgi:molecular chaperone Hsp33